MDDKNQKIWGRGGKLSGKIHKETFWNYDNIVHVDNILFVDQDRAGERLGYTSKNSLNCTVKIYAFYCVLSIL